MKKNERVISKKNYLYLLLMIVSVVFLTVYIFDLNKKYHSRKLEVSYLNEYISEVSVNDLNNILTEPSSELFILVTKTNNHSVYKLESDIKKVIKKYDLRDNFIFIDYTDKEDSLKELNEIIGSDIRSVPAVIYLRNGNFVKSIDSYEDVLSIGDLEQLLDEYEVK